MQVGTVLSLPDLAMAEIVARSFDFAWIDLEHSTLDLREVESLAIVCQGHGCSAFVRVPGSNSERIPPVLDAGVDGLVVPMVEDADEARQIAEAFSYPPRGRRGFGPRRASRHGHLERFWEREEERPACWLQIETMGGAAAAPEIAAVEGVDALVIGTADLALDLGVPGSIDDQRLQKSIADTANAAREAGISFALAAGGVPEGLLQTVPPGTNAIVYSVDARIYASVMSDTAERLRQAAGSAGFRVALPKEALGG